ncbi:transcriptional regulator [Haloferax sp. ATB1]|uniref:transcriptional regulator n=1 Tax=Haloferax sp. ATB1 TaxID=1508454 RepID=UPI0006936B06|nr:transcriptional regulator [Haloferax sp. ATB1]
MTSSFDWESLLWETRGFLGLEDDEAVPRGELVQQAVANGYQERETRQALRDTDALELAGDLDDPRVRLADAATDAERHHSAADKPDAALDTTDDTPSDDVAEPQDTTTTSSTWADADFSAPETGVFPPELLGREQWMGHVEKKPFAPWADRDAPAPCSRDNHDAETTAECDCDARWKWGFTENYVDGETIAMAEVDERLDGRAFLQQPDDPYVYVDGDDVRDEETGEIHPAFAAILEHLGLTYADISQSGAGAHAIYRGDLPDGVKQAAWQLDDEPWGSNEDLPSIEIYPGKRVCVMTGEHVPGTPTEVRNWNGDVLDALLEANDQTTSGGRKSVSTARDDYDLDNYEPAATTANETTDDIRDIFAALDRLDARRVADRTIVFSWNDEASTSQGKRAFAPTWGKNSSGTANIVDERIWQDTGDEGGYGGPVIMALIDAGELSHRNVSPSDARGEMWFKGIDHLRDLGFDIPKLERSSGSSDRDEDLPPLLEDAIESDEDIDASPESALPLAQLDALSPDERRRAAKKRGLRWPSTREARDKLFAKITEAMRHEDETVIDAPTSLGKSYTVVTEAWDSEQYKSVTGGRPVVHLSATRDARDEAIEAADEAGINYFALLSRHEACPVAAGDHDPEHVQGTDRQAVTINGVPASEWLTRMCEGRGIAFSAAHRHLETHNDQNCKLPCCHGSPTTYDEEDGEFEEGEASKCPAIKQWEDLRNKDAEDLAVIIATHNFAHVPGLRTGNNVVIDEEPDFTADLSKDRIARAITAYLKEIDAPVKTWESFVQLSLHEGWEGDAARERNALRDQLNREPDREWYFETDGAHTLAPALARAIFHAEDRGNGRRVGKTPHEPPRLDAQVSDDDGWNREWVSVVLDEDNEVRTVRTAPDLSQARSVIGLDAHPARPVWSVNTVPHINTTPVLEPEERQLWRRFERGLRVVQVGDATRPLASGEYFNERQVETVVEHLHEEYGHYFRTAITTGAVEQQLKQIMADTGVQTPDTMHYGEEKSRNDFAHERIGLIEGCIDPGDDFVVDLLAELDLDAAPKMVDVDGEEQRAHGREFVGDDADVAGEILASVRENHTAQAAGRYARNPEDPDSHATVFVRTDAVPTGFADIQVPGVEWCFTEKQRAIVEQLRESPTTTSARELADAVGVSKEHVRKTLGRLADGGSVDAFDRAGPHGATLYGDSGLPASGTVDFGDSQTANNPVLDTYTWALAISDPDFVANAETDEAATDDTADPVTWDWKSGSTHGG